MHTHTDIYIYIYICIYIIIYIYIHTYSLPSCWCQDLSDLESEFERQLTEQRVLEEKIDSRRQHAAILTQAGLQLHHLPKKLQFSISQQDIPSR